MSHNHNLYISVVWGVTVLPGKTLLSNALTIPLSQIIAKRGLKLNSSYRIGTDAQSIQVDMCTHKKPDHLYMCHR